MPHPHFRYWKRRFARLPAVAPILLTGVALLVMVIREARRLWPYRDQYQLAELLAAADAVVVVSLMVGTVLCTVAAFSPAGLERRRLPFWRQGQIERAKSGNFGTADWMPISEAKKRLPNAPGIVVGEAYRVDQDKVAKRPFNPKDRRSWGKGGSAPLLEYRCDTSSTHGLVFAGAGGFKIDRDCSPDPGSVAPFDHHPRSLKRAGADDDRRAQEDAPGRHRDVPE